MIVWLASWPRSGNTFVRILLKTCLGVESYSIHSDPYFDESNDQVKEWVGQKQYHGDQDEFLARCRADPGLHIIKTHNPPVDLSPAIYVVRHGLAACVSYQQYARLAEGTQLGLLEIVNGCGWAGSWGNHVRTWDPLHRPNTLLVRYEALVADAYAEALRIGTFLQRPVSGDNIPAFAALTAADPQFFRSGSPEIDPSDVPEEVVEAFWECDGDVAAMLGYARPLIGTKAPPAPATIVSQDRREPRSELSAGSAMKYLVYRCGMVGLGHTLQSILNCMFLAHSTGRVLALDLRRFPFFANERQAAFFSVFDLKGPYDLAIETDLEVVDTLLLDPGRLGGEPWQDVELTTATPNRVVVIDSTRVRTHYTLADKAPAPLYRIELKGEMASRIAARLAELPPRPRIGVHFRHGNGEYLQTRINPIATPDYRARYSELKLHFANTAELVSRLRNYQDPGHFIASDSVEFIESLKNLLPGHPYCSSGSLPFPWYDAQARSEEMEFLFRALSDVWSLSSCDFLIHARSAFSEFAALNSTTLTVNDVHCIRLRTPAEIIGEAPAEEAVAMATNGLRTMLRDCALEMELPSAYGLLRGALTRAGNSAAADIVERRRRWVHRAIQSKDFNDSRWLRQRGRAADALMLVQRARDAMPDNPHVALVLAQLLRFQRQYAEAHSALDGLLELDRAYPGAQLELSHVLDCLGRFGDALAAARAAASQDPADSIAAARLSELEDRVVEGGVLMNVAIGKRATQSSYSPWSHKDDPMRAINGSRTDIYAFCTNVENEPWWELDLGSGHLVKRIVVYNRDDEWADRAKTLELRATEDAQTPWQTLHRQNATFGGTRTGTPLVLELAEPVVLRHLRLLLHERTHLHLVQVEVYSLIADHGTSDSDSSSASQQPSEPEQTSLHPIQSTAQAADQLEQIGKSLLALDNNDAAQHAFEAAAEIDLANPVLQSSFGGPLNGQRGRTRLVLDMLDTLAPAAIIETGTFRGTTTEWLASVYAGQILTCEIEPRFFMQARRKLARFKHVAAFNDDSRAFLAAILPTLPTNRPVLYYLDAHWHNDLPLAEEVRSILGYSLYSVIMIDDFRVPWDAGYGFDSYGPDKTLDLKLLSFLAGSQARVFFPALRADDETGAKRGTCVIAAAPPIVDKLRRLSRLRESDWNGEAYSATSSDDGLPKNIARGCRASQSSMSIWSHPDDAQGGVDGVIDGYFGFHTEFEPNPWWMVDFGAVAQFDEIVIYNRMDGCSERASALRVIISSDGERWECIHTQGGIPFGGIDGNPLRVRHPRARARYIKLQLDSTDYLHLDEVQVLRYAMDSVARGKALSDESLTGNPRDNLQPILA